MRFLGTCAFSGGLQLLESLGYDRPFICILWKYIHGVQETLHTMKALKYPLKVPWDHITQRQDPYSAPSN